MTRVDATDVTDEVKETKVIMEKKIEDIASELVKANSTKFGTTIRDIQGSINDSIIDYCCRYQEDGYAKGLIDGMQINGMINSLTVKGGCC